MSDSWDILAYQLRSATSFAEKWRLFEEVVPSLDENDVDLLVSDLLYYYAVFLRGDGFPQQSFKAAQVIYLIGAARKNRDYRALGNMVRGDARNSQQLYASAWIYLQSARMLFTHNFGRARTMIGLLLCAVDANRAAEITEESFTEAKQAFEDRGDYSRLVLLYRNRGLFHRRQGKLHDLEAAQFWFMCAQETARAHIDPRSLTSLVDLGVIAGERGDNLTAKHFFQQVCDDPQMSLQRQDRLMALQNLACSEKALGQYRSALQHLDELLDTVEREKGENRQIYLLTTQTKIECYLELNKFDQVELLARQLLVKMSGLPPKELITIQYYLAQALIALGEYAPARQQIERMLNSLQSQAAEKEAESQTQWMLTRLLRGQLALLEGEIPSALDVADAALEFFGLSGHTLEQANAHLLAARGYWKLAIHPQAVEDHARTAAEIARRSDAPTLLYRAYLLLGYAREAQDDFEGAQHHYEKAAEVVDQIERSLTMVLRPGFLSDKGEPLQALLRLHLNRASESTGVKQAFETLERSKSRIFLEYLVENNGFQYVENPLIQERQAKLSQLRSNYLSYREKAADDRADRAVRNAAYQQAEHNKAEMSEIVRQIYDFIERNHHEDFRQTPSVRALQEHIPAKTLLIEYYDDGESTYAFTLDSETVMQHRLAPIDQVREQFHWLEKRAQSKIAMLSSLSGSETDPITLLKHPYLNDPADNRAFNLASGALYTALIEPLAARLKNVERLIIVPYGQLHYLPFHLLYAFETPDGTDGKYLIQDFEVVVLPAASLLVRPPIEETGGNMTLYDDLQETLRFSRRDAERVHALTGGSLYSTTQVDPKVILHQAHGDILHIIAHGQFDSTHPELSFIQLGEEPLMMNDLLELGMAFQLVTLTACEAGKLKLTEYDKVPSMGDDLIGLGRAFLYAGARSLLVSRWHIGDGLTLPLVERFYQALRQGCSKSKALQQAQLDLLAMIPTLHPVFWGVFQLIGDAAPLEHFQPVNSSLS